ncbi:hypothetical protein [Taklimakanibacter deserti]|uniref:hypothetical protein n=1 Tax=Taklimakanibacter deserti TaxID=2267839 RepID=UPI000E65833E
MHILIALVGILGVAAVWYWRLKAIKETTDDVTDMAGRAWGKWKRYKFRRKAEAAPVEAVDDPVAAAVIMMMAIAAEERPLTQTAETAIRGEVVKTMGIADPTELMVFGKWVASHVEDANNVSLRYAKLWMRDLSQGEREDFLRMVRRVAAADGEVTARQQLKIAKLAERLGLK